MRKAKIFVHAKEAGYLEELTHNHYRFTYLLSYEGPSVSLTMPKTQQIYDFETFPPFFEGLLPEGVMLEALLKRFKLDRKDYFGQLLQVGQDVVGAVTIVEVK